MTRIYYYMPSLYVQAYRLRQLSHSVWKIIFPDRWESWNRKRWGKKRRNVYEMRREGKKEKEREREEQSNKSSVQTATNGYRRTNRVIVSTGTAQSIVRQYWNALRVSDRRNWDGNKSDNKEATATYALVATIYFSYIYIYILFVSMIFLYRPRRFHFRGWIKQGIFRSSQLIYRINGKKRIRNYIKAISYDVPFAVQAFMNQPVEDEQPVFELTRLA